MPKTEREEYEDRITTLESQLTAAQQQTCPECGGKRHILPKSHLSIHETCPLCTKTPGSVTVAELWKRLREANAKIITQKDIDWAIPEELKIAHERAEKAEAAAKEADEASDSVSAKCDEFEAQVHEVWAEKEKAEAERDQWIDTARLCGKHQAEAEAALKTEQEEVRLLTESNERFEQKLKDWNINCACEYDNKGDVCMVHHPRIKKAEAANADLRAINETGYAKLKEVRIEYTKLRAALEAIAAGGDSISPRIARKALEETPDES